MDEIKALLTALAGEAAAEAFAVQIDMICRLFGIHSSARRASFIAWLAHETRGFTAFGFDGRGAAHRLDLGPLGFALDLPLEEEPGLLKDPERGLVALGWHWKITGRGAAADGGDAAAAVATWPETDEAPEASLVAGLRACLAPGAGAEA